jgi:acetyl esterase/lipase
MHLAVAAMIASTTLSYGPDAKQRVDVYSPSSATPRGIAVFLHGGVWQFGDRSDYSEVGETLAKAGYVAFIASYRLAPAHVWPAQLEDAASVVSLALDEGAKRGADPKKLVVIGHSAGAQLAMILAHKRNDIAALALLSGVFDLRAPLDDTRPDGGFAQFVAPAFGKDPPRHASPIQNTKMLNVPILLVTSEFDYPAMRKQTFAMRKVLQERGEKVGFVDVKGVDHFGIVASLGVRNDPTLPKIVALLP